MSLRTNTRGGAGNGLNFFLAIALTAFMAYLLNIFAGYVIPMSEEVAGDQQTMDAIRYSELGILYWPAIMLITCCIWLLVREVTDRRLGI